ncbi:TM2 domain-containing protein 3-like [Denticeps clupeoides]|uniref:TM2 domain-containing protein 3 n=1 Tax=Denticeps clupeoides TaxID=299321 RepID=A0A8C4CBF1_9TELE|nr:TM2 domain-containing protein 3-like [Denticeps clupeoides]XP_028825072.1 TM2 domain-containing protein 3-like [Denticeps clupeoides]
MATLWSLRRAARRLAVMRAHGLLLLLLAEPLVQPAHGYLSSTARVSQPPYNRDEQYSPVITSPMVPASPSAAPTKADSDLSKCPSGGRCDRLPVDCMTCDLHHNCTYGKPAEFSCQPKRGVHCTGESGAPLGSFNLTMTCQFCWQLDLSLYRCEKSFQCKTVACPRRRYNATCEVLEHVHCLGRRKFQKRLFCNWTGGYKWSTALALSITLGGFGADRFYLGQWREGLGKLFSFGGLGIWTLIDVLLIGVGYVGPADGSLYI